MMMACLTIFVPKISNKLINKIHSHYTVTGYIAHHWAVPNCGMAHGHRGNTAKGLRLERIYGAPVLLSGVALVLSSPE